MIYNYRLNIINHLNDHNMVRMFTGLEHNTVASNHIVDDIAL